MNTLITELTNTVKTGIQKVTGTSDEGLETAEKIFLTVGSIVIAGLAITGVTTFVNGQVDLLP